MKIRIDDIPADGLKLIFSGSEDILSESLTTIPAPTGAQIDPRVEGMVNLVRSGSNVLITGAVRALINLQCARCLQQFTEQETADLMIKLRPTQPGAEPDEETADVDEDILPMEGSVLHLSDLILQEIILEIPMKPLCREDCPGLCPRCGALLGSPDCKCPTEETVDPRWQALARLKKEEAS